MGADITFYWKDKLFYFRDSYNFSNLAWVIGMSYWNCKKTLKARKEFFIKMSKITNKEIEEYVELAHEDPEEKHIKPDFIGWCNNFKNARNEIKKNIKIIKNAKRVSWGV